MRCLTNCTSLTGPHLNPASSNGMLLLPRTKCLSLLGVFGHIMHVKQLKQVHGHMIVSGLCRHVPTICKLVESYCGCISDSERMTYTHLIYRQAEKPERQMIWNIMIRYSAPQEAILLYSHGIGAGMIDVADKFTFTFVLGACARSAALFEGRQIHAQVLKTGHASDIAIQTTSIHFYSCCNDIHSAFCLFNEIEIKNSVSWNAMIGGYCLVGHWSNEHARKALYLFCDMLMQLPDIRPSETTMVELLSACSHLGVLATGTCFHGFICKTILFPDRNLFIGTCLINMYSKCGCLGSAKLVFERMEERNVLTWTAMIEGLAIHGQGKEALSLLDDMKVKGIAPNAVTFTCLLCACCHAGFVEEGLYLFQTMSSRFGIKPCIQHYGCIVDILSRAGLVEQAYEFINDMPIQPDLIMWRTLLGACKIHGNFELGERIGDILLQIETSLPGTYTFTKSTSEDYIALSNIYASAGRWEDVVAVRGVMKGKGIQNKPGCSAIQLSKFECG